MKTLQDAVVRDATVFRLSQLSEGDTALWGSMSVDQMVCHLNDAFCVALGKKTARSTTSLFQRTVMKWGALHLPMPWPQGVPTVPEVKQGVGGSPPVEFGQDRSALLLSLEHFCTQLPNPPLPHAMFGPMTRADWMRWGYLHTDHHLRQFGR